MGKNNKKYNLEEIKEIFKSKGFELLSDVYVNNKSKLNFRDNEGYLYLNSVNSVIYGCRLHRFSKSNIYALDNVKLYLSKNTRTILVKDDNFSPSGESIFKCECGILFKRRFNTMMQQKTFVCRECSSGVKISKSHISKSYIETMAEKHGLSLCGEYIKSKAKSKYKDEFGYLYFLNLDSLRRRKCSFRKFGETNKYTLENIKNWINIENKNYELLSTTFTKYKEKLKFKCKENGCEEVFYVDIHNLISYSYNCPYCSGRQVGKSNCLKTKRPDLYKEFNIGKNKNYSPEEIYYRSTKNVWWTCAICQNEWETSPNNRVRLHSGCPSCSSSNMEREIKHFFINNDIRYFAQHTFNGCRSKQLLYFDFYLEQYNICIEANGKQHYKPIDFFGGVEQFKKQQKHDQIKRDYCKKNNIKLIEIPYWDFDNIEKILIRELYLKKDTQ